MKTIEIDGSAGEGGGQILRTSLALAMTTGQPVLIERIRAKRSKPGLMRQHLTCVQAAGAVCAATVQGAELGSQRLLFEPGPARAGDYAFSVGTAGSCMLVLQTVLPALMLAAAPSRVTLSGGTHNPLRRPGVRQEGGPGNALMATLVHEHVCKAFPGFGEKGVTAERVAQQLAREVRAFIASDSALGPHLADQGMLPLALAVNGRGVSAAFSCTEMTEHARTNIQVIETFLPLQFAVEPLGSGWRVQVE